MKWYKHDTDANMDAKIQEVLLDYGLEGYGLYFYCLELIAGKTSNSNLTFELEHDARIIARNTGSTSQKVEEMIRSFIRLRLFECSDGRITCLKMAQRLDKSMTSNHDMRKSIEELRKNPPQNHDYGANSHDSVMISHDSVSNGHERLEEKRIDKIRIDKIRESEQTPTRSKFVKNSPPSQDDVINHMTSKGHSEIDAADWAEDYMLHFKGNGWIVGKAKAQMQCWKSAATSWAKRNAADKAGNTQQRQSGFETTQDRRTRKHSELINDLCGDDNMKRIN